MPANPRERQRNKREGQRGTERDRQQRQTEWQSDREPVWLMPISSHKDIRMSQLYKKKIQYIIHSEITLIRFCIIIYNYQLVHIFENFVSSVEDAQSLCRTSRTARCLIHAEPISKHIQINDIVQNIWKSYHRVIWKKSWKDPGFEIVIFNASDSWNTGGPPHQYEFYATPEARWYICILCNKILINNERKNQPQI